MKIPENCFECKHRKIEKAFVNNKWRNVSCLYIGLKGKVLPVVKCELSKTLFCGDYMNKKPTMCPLNYEALLVYSRKLQEINISHPSNCKNCGAPLTSNQCSYCNTKY